jgi:hypothetical protein
MERISRFIKWLCRMAELRTLAELVFADFFPAVSDLVAVGELTATDIGETGKPNFVVTHRGKPLVTGFKAQPLAWMYFRKHLCAPATLTFDQQHGEVEFSHDDFAAGQKSRAIH